MKKEVFILPLYLLKNRLVGSMRKESVKRGYNKRAGLYISSFNDESKQRYLTYCNFLKQLKWDSLLDVGVYQYVSTEKKKAFVLDISKCNPDIKITEEDDLAGLLSLATKQVMFLSGNLSWVNASQGNVKIIDVIRELVKRNVSIKIVARVSMIGLDNAKKLLAINKEIGRDLIEIRHRYQPLRMIIVDDKLLRFREIKRPEFYSPGELTKDLAIFYYIYDQDWISWLQKIFWKMFSTTISAEKRIKEIESVRTIIN